MKNDKEHIDQLFESLNDRQFEIPEAFLEDLNKRLDEKPKKRKYVFLWFLLPLVLIGAIGLGYFSYPGPSEVKSPGEQSAKISSKDRSTANSKTQPNSFLSEQLQNTPSPSDSISVLSTGKNRSASIQTFPAKKQTGSFKKTSNPSNTNQVQRNRQIFKTQKPLANQSNKIKNTHKKSDSEILKGKQPKGIKPRKNGVHQKTKIEISEIKTKNDPLLSSDKDQKIPNETERAAVSAAAGDISSALMKESAPEKDSVTTQNTADSIQQAVPVPAKKDAAKPKTPGNDWRKEITLFAGLGGNSIQDSPKNSEYLAKIKESQTSILAPSFGINANFSYKKFTFGSGINYEQTGEKFNVDIKSAELKDSTYSEFIQDTIWVQDSIGNWIPVPHDTTIYHTVQYTDSVWASKSFQNRYSWISIPLHFGYRFEWGNYELIPRIGAVFNFGIASGAGTYPNTSFNNTNRYPPARFTVSYLIQLEARRNFDRWFVFINPYFRSMINPAVSGDVIRRRYSSWGMQFGIGLNLK